MGTRRTDSVQLPDGPGLVVVTAAGRTPADAEECGHLALSLRDELVRMRRTDLIVVVLAPGQDVAALDAGQMAQHGWIRRQDKQTGSPPTSLGTDQAPLPKDHPGRG